MNPLPFLLTCIAGRMNPPQQLVIEYLHEEIRLLKEQMGRRPRFNDDQRRRLAMRGKSIGRKALLRFASIVTLDTLLGWHRRLIATKYDSGIRLMTREVHIAGIVPEPNDDWMKQVAGNLTDASEGFCVAAVI